MPRSYQAPFAHCFGKVSTHNALQHTYIVPCRSWGFPKPLRHNIRKALTCQGHIQGAACAKAVKGLYNLYIRLPQCTLRALQMFMKPLDPQALQE